jgi:hypothetical protein
MACLRLRQLCGYTPRAGTLGKHRFQQDVLRPHQRGGCVGVGVGVRLVIHQRREQDAEIDLGGGTEPGDDAGIAGHREGRGQLARRRLANG